MKYTLLFLLLTAIIYPLPAAADYIAWGTSLSYIHDEGTSNISSDEITSTQQTLNAGIFLKADLWRFCFIRTGIHRSFPLTTGSAPLNTDDLPETWRFSRYSYTLQVAAFFPVEDYGMLYMGSGITLMKIDGQVEAPAPMKLSEKKYGYSFIIGMQARLSESFSLYAEWENLHAASIYTEDYKIDLSGQRINIGVLYYFVRNRL